MVLHFVLMLCACNASKKSTVIKQHTVVDAALVQATNQYQYLMTITPQGLLPRTFEKGALATTKSDGWVSGFYPGTLLELFEYTHDSALLREAELRMALLKKEQWNKNTHDLGFMMYCSFGTADKVLKSRAYDTVLINSARSLATRFNPTVGCIRSWNSDPAHFLVIIDNMMNLELLFYAFQQTHDSSFYKIAVTHANTTMKNHFRSDYSSYHVVDYNEKTGAVQEKKTHQGAANESAWARGQAWGLYGFTVMYRETKDEKYLAQARHIANFIINHPNLPADKIPYWDFNAPGIPNALRDASAAAIISSALFELCNYVPAKDKKIYYKLAEEILLHLSRQPYKTTGNEQGGFILQHSVGHMPNHTEVDVPLSYADYYYVEAALRYMGK